MVIGILYYYLSLLMCRRMLMAQRCHSVVNGNGSDRTSYGTIRINTRNSKSFDTPRSTVRADMYLPFILTVYSYLVALEYTAVYSNGYSLTYPFVHSLLHR